MCRNPTTTRTGRWAEALIAAVACGLAGGCASNARDQFLASQQTTVRAVQVSLAGEPMLLVNSAALEVETAHVNAEP